MAEQVQTYKNHTRFFPLFHFIVSPILLANVFVVWGGCALAVISVLKVALGGGV